jgi:REP element-mobilizing transposase RayT
MARKLRVAFEGALYHVTIRGVERRTLAADDADRERLLAQIAKGVEFDQVRVFLFCLMTNHLHLVVETPLANLSAFMHRLQTGYTVYFNLRHRRAGHLMQGRYGATLVSGDEYLLKLSRYVHLNPVYTAGTRDLPLKERLRQLRRYRWSSYAGYIGRQRRLDFVTYAPLLALVSAGRWGREREYRKFVESGMVERDEEFKHILQASRLSLGPEEFRVRIRDLYQDLVDAQKHPEDVALRLTRRRLPPATVRAAVVRVLGAAEEEIGARHGRGSVRPVLAWMLCRFSGLSQREAAQVLGLRTGAAVSMQLRTLAHKLHSSQTLSRQVAAIEKELRAH